MLTDFALLVFKIAFIAFLLLAAYALFQALCVAGVL